jgi:glyceraldehyde 3-phosphate dehydrogenase
MNILLNGVGRIGKLILRLALEKQDFNIVAINEINQNIENIAYVINYDSTYGRLEDKFKVDGNFIKNSVSNIEILNYKSLKDIDFRSKNIDIVIDASGIKVDLDILNALDIKHIFLTHPRKDVQNIVLGVNEKKLDKKDIKVISTSSCNATALSVLLKLIDDKFGIEFGDVTTIHPLLNHQKTLDSNCISKSDRDINCNFEFGRSSTQNIIPSGTTTIEACSYLLPNIDQNIISSSSFRVPTSTVGAINVVLSLKKSILKDDIVDMLYRYEQTQQYDILSNNTEPLVSNDFAKTRFTTIVDHRFLEVKNNKMVKFVLWYDNEWGYASKVVDIVKLLLNQ